MAIALTAGCQNSRRRSRAQWADSERQDTSVDLVGDLTALATDMAFEFKAIEHLENESAMARLDFEVYGAAGAQPMVLIPSGERQGAEFSLEFCTVEIEPVLSKTKVTNSIEQKAQLLGGYKIEVDLPNGSRWAQFEVTDLGKLVQRGGTLNSAFESEMIITEALTLYVLSRKPPGGGGPGTPELGVAYQQRGLPTSKWFTGSDGWHYKFKYPDGVLLLYPAGAIGEMPAQMRELAALEEKQREERASAPPARCGG